MKKAALLIKISFKGLGQIMLQDNAITGLLFFVGICLHSFTMGIAAIVASFIGSLTALFAKFDQDRQEQGLFGFSAALIGVAIVLFLKPSFLYFATLIIASITAAFLQNFFIQKKIAAFTLPFVLLTWIILFFSKYFFPELIIAQSPLGLNDYDKYVFPFKAYGQVIFQSEFYIGILFFVAVALHNLRAAIFGLLGSLLATGCAYILKIPLINIFNGLSSFNAVLCAFVFSEKAKGQIVWAIFSVVLSVIIGAIMTKLSLTMLTFPFVISCFLVILLKKYFIKKAKVTSSIN
ncbi:MAG TPA: urea transporter [Edaphocola sp.]|nr:urea transporter [Edaphocola sp.]